MQIETTPVMRGAVHPVRSMVVRPRVEEAFGFAEVQVLDFADLYAGKLAAALETWRQLATDAFLGAYRDTMTDSPVWPPNRAAAERLLDFFLIEKALYEIEYELAHRPDWLRVPLAGILRILSRGSEETV